MKPSAWDRARQALAETPARKTLAPSDTFWETFHARAQHRPQETAEPATTPWMARRYGIAFASAAAAVLLVALGLLLLPVAPAAAGTQIKSVEVTAPHSAVLIMTDAPSKSAILWVVDMAGEPTKDSP